MSGQAGGPKDFQTVLNESPNHPPNPSGPKLTQQWPGVFGPAGFGNRLLVALATEKTSSPFPEASRTKADAAAAGSALVPLDLRIDFWLRGRLKRHEDHVKRSPNQLPNPAGPQPTQRWLGWLWSCWVWKQIPGRADGTTNFRTVFEACQINPRSQQDQSGPSSGLVGFGPHINSRIQKYQS